MSLFRKITETVTKGVSTATEKAQQTVEITRVHAQISGKRKEMEKLFAGIGEAVYGGYKAKDISLAEAKAIPICEEIDRLQSEIESLEERLMQLRNEKECECGKRVTYDTRFCPSCGRPFPDPEPHSDPVAEQAIPSDETADHPAEPTVSADSRSDDPPALPSGEVIRENAPSVPGWTNVESAGERRVETAVCPNCGASMEETDRICPSCGTARS